MSEGKELMDKYGQWLVEVPETARIVLEEIGLFAPTVSCLELVGWAADTEDGGQKKVYWSADYCREVAQALVEAAAFLERRAVLEAEFRKTD